MINSLQLTNMVRSEVGHISDTGLPLEVFPEKIKKIILDLASYENYNVEYTASIILSAISTAIGNSCYVRIKGEWKTNPALFMMLVGRPGLGKTPPLGFLYTPINEHDDKMFEKYVEECKMYEDYADKEDKSIEKPHFVNTVVSDFTPEAMLFSHKYNPRGIALVVDEILALFNSASRYSSKNNLIEILLSAYSGQPIKIIRKSEANPIFIKRPCINIIGSIQTNIVNEVFRKDFISNGLLDRFLFVYPNNQKISSWKEYDNIKEIPEITREWKAIIDQILAIPCDVDEKGNISPKILSMTDDARRYFFKWQNGIIDSINAIEDDKEVESRKIKLNGHAGRLALIFQVMKWAASSYRMDSIDLDSVKSAIRMIEYYEDTYRRIEENLVSDQIGEVKEDWLSSLGDTFSAAEAVSAGRQFDMSKRTIYYALKKLCKFKNPVIEKLEHGCYRKIKSSIALCTFALSSEKPQYKPPVEDRQSAKVQTIVQNDSSDDCPF